MWVREASPFFARVLRDDAGSLMRAGLVLIGFGLFACSLRADIILNYSGATADLYDLAGNSCLQSASLSASCSFSGANSSAVVNNATGGLATVTLGSTATAGAAVTAYATAIIGPSNVNVPVIISGMASTQDNNDQLGASYAAYYFYQGSATGAVWYYQWFASPAACAYIIADNIPCQSAGPFALHATLTSNTAFFVEILAAAGGINASATIDPIITIDPSFPLASEFTVEATPGVFTPEPSSLSFILLAGIGGLVGARRKFRRNIRKA